MHTMTLYILDSIGYYQATITRAEREESLLRFKPEEEGSNRRRESAMAAPFRDLELIMENNIRLSGASPSPSPSCRSPLPSSMDALPASSVASELQEEPAHVPQLQGHFHRHGFAALSLAFGSVLPPLAFTPPAANPILNRPSAAALPSQKKCISPSPIMPAIGAVATVEVAAAASTLSTKKSSRSSTAFPDYQRLPDKDNQFGDPKSAAAMRRASIVWFRNDLRCHDNEALDTATKESLSILPVYCFDPRDYGKSSSGFDKTGPYRAKFLLECVSNLRQSLQERGSDLIVIIGKPEEVLVSLAKSIGADALYAHQEVSSEEVQCESNVCAALKDEGVDVKYFWGSTLFHKDDLPFKLEEMPITYSAFREKVQNVNIRQALEAPKQLRGLPARGNVKPGDIPSLQELGLRPISAGKQDAQAVAPSPLIGGEAEALKRLKSFAVDHAKQSNNKVGSGGCGDSLYGSNFSCKISPWLAMGCLSPRRMFEDLKNTGRSMVSTSASAATSTDNGLNWLVFELLWRDFFRFITKKYAANKQVSEVASASSSSAVPA